MVIIVVIFFFFIVFVIVIEIILDGIDIFIYDVIKK